MRTVRGGALKGAEVEVVVEIGLDGQFIVWGLGQCGAAEQAVSEASQEVLWYAMGAVGVLCWVCSVVFVLWRDLFFGRDASV